MKKTVLVGVLVALALASLAGYIFYAPARASVSIKDPPPEQYASSITSIDVTFTKIEVHSANAGNESGWHTITTSATINLLVVLNVSKVLGSAQLSPGKYTELRLFAGEATITIAGVTVIYTIPSGAQTGIKVVIAGGLQVYGGQNANILLDFAFRNSEIIGNTSGNLSPVVSATVA